MMQIRPIALTNASRYFVGSFVAAALVLGVVFVSSAEAATGPMEVVKATVNDALPVLRDKSTPVQQRQEKLKQIVAASFDFTEMAKSAMGFHWKQLTPAQQQEFTATFTTFIEDSYLAKINEFKNQQVQFGTSRNDGPEYAEVTTNIVQEGKDPIALNFRLLKRGNDWKIYDVTVDAISIIANYRNQFNRVMNNDGYPKLIADLKAKQAGLAASLGTR